MKALIGKIKRRFVYNYRISRLPISKAIGSDKFCSHRAYSFINCCKGQRLIWVEGVCWHSLIYQSWMSLWLVEERVGRYVVRNACLPILMEPAIAVDYHKGCGISLWDVTGEEMWRLLQCVNLFTVENNWNLWMNQWAGKKQGSRFTLQMIIKEKNEGDA